MIKYGSLFSGIGGFDIGFDRAGMTCAWQVEKDEAASSVLKNHWPDVPKWEDIKDVGKQNLESVDLICGGFPCQDVSIAGRREGLAGERSGLWFEFRRIVEELRPQWVVIENVPGLLSSNGGRDMGAIVGGLAKLGYWWAYRVLDAQYFGVPQRRRRVFIVASLAKGRPQEVLFERESSPWDTPPSRETREELAGAITAGTHSGSGERGYPIEREAELTVNHVEIHGGSNKRKDRPNGGFYTREMPTTNKPLDTSGLNPACAQGGSLICFAPQAGGNTGLNINENLSGTLQENQVMAVAYDGRNLNDTGEITSTLQSKKNGGYSLNYQPLVAFGGNSQKPVSVATTCNAHGSRYDFESETFICNTFNGYTGGADDNDAQANHIVWDNGQGDPNADESDTSYCLNGQANQGVGTRRLTPVECERLQGFPDQHTAGQSDSARYRQLGNAVAVPVAEWLGRRMLEVL